MAMTIDSPYPLTDLELLRDRLEDDHNWMMWASVEALSEEDRTGFDREGNGVGDSGMASIEPGRG